MATKEAFIDLPDPIREPAGPCLIVIFGAAGDLTKRKLMPSLYNLAKAQLLPKEFKGQPYRSTDATIFCAVEGRGTTTIGEKTFSWGPRDIFVVPSWHPVSHQVNEESVLFSFSDRPAQKSLVIWREDASA